MISSFFVRFYETYVAHLIMIKLCPKSVFVFWPCIFLWMQQFWFALYFLFFLDEIHCPKRTSQFFFFLQIMATMTGHFMGQMFTCCIDGGEPRNVRNRPRIDRSMIGSPTDFRHTAHIGSNDVYGGSSDNFGLLQTQMKSKGGYSVMVNQVPYVPHIINARNLDEVRRKWYRK